MIRRKKELEIQTPILKKLRALEGSYWFKIHDIITAGIPDIIGLYKGRFIAIEVKRPGEKPTMLQYRILDIIRMAGGLAYWTDNTEDVKGWVELWKKMIK